VRHADLAAYVADRLGGWRHQQHRDEYVAALTRALDDRRFNRCTCNGDQLLAMPPAAAAGQPDDARGRDRLVSRVPVREGVV
jgi:hypothetical protein